jgi:hypothetical protein
MLSLDMQAIRIIIHSGSGLRFTNRGRSSHRIFTRRNPHINGVTILKVQIWHASRVYGKRWHPWGISLMI